jgi:hypothetical protein
MFFAVIMSSRDGDGNACQSIDDALGGCRSVSGEPMSAF